MWLFRETKLPLAADDLVAAAEDEVVHIRGADAVEPYHAVHSSFRFIVFTV